MPRPTKSIPQYRRHKASGQAVVTIEGRDFYLGPHGSKISRREYDRLVGEWIAGGRQLKPQANEITCVELIARYWKWAQGYYQRDGKSTRVTPSIKCALRYLNRCYGDLPALQFGPLSLQSLREQMVADGWPAPMSINIAIGSNAASVGGPPKSWCRPVSPKRCRWSAASCAARRPPPRDHR